MTTDDTTEPKPTKPTRRKALCYHCCNLSWHRVLHEGVYTTDGFWVADGTPVTDIGVFEFVSICETCDRVSVYDLYWDDHDGSDPHEAASVSFPQFGLEGSVPQAIADVYAEASKVKPHSRLAFAILLRRALEETCNEQGVGTPKDPLAKRLKALAAKHNMPSPVLKITEMVKVIGNTAAHGGKELQPGHIAAMDSFFKIFVDYVYVIPQRIASFETQWNAAPKK